MRRLEDFPVTKKWPPRHPDRLQLYSLPTPNGLKVSIMLEETGLPYEFHRVDFSAREQKSPEFAALNPNKRIPAIIDPDGPDGAPFPLWESGAILIYLAEKTGRLMPQEPVRRYEALQWLMFQMGNVGPMVGQVGVFNKFEKEKYSGAPVLLRYVDETVHLLGVLDRRLDGRDWLMDDYSIVDIATAPWLRNIVGSYKAGDLVGWSGFTNLPAYLDRFLARPAVQAALPKPAS
jgi:GST-like protein